MEGEYSGLRAEILSWQERRVTVATRAAALTGALLGLVTALGGDFQWSLLSAVLLVILASSMVFVIYSADANMRIGAYLRATTNKGGWESANAEVRGRVRVGFRRFVPRDVNQAIAIIYFALGVASIAIPASANPERPPAESLAVFIAATVVFSAIWIWLLLLSYSWRDVYDAAFEAVLEERRGDP